MSKKAWNYIFIGVCSMLFLFGVSYFLTLTSFSPNTNLYIVSNNKTTPIQVHLADTEQKREQGFSNVKRPEGNQGMLFVFDTPRIAHFWMKNMLFPIDIIWFNQQGVVVHTHSNLQPSTYPTTFSAPNPVTYVLEMPSGFVSTHVVSVGDKLIDLASLYK